MSPAPVRSICPSPLLSCHPTTRTRWLRVAESIVTVIVPFVGIGMKRTTFAGVMKTPLIWVMTVEIVPTPSALWSALKSQNEYELSEFKTMLPELITANASVPVRPFSWKVYVCCPLPGTAKLTVLSSFAVHDGVTLSGALFGGVPTAATSAQITYDVRPADPPPLCETVHPIARPFVSSIGVDDTRYAPPAAEPPPPSANVPLGHIAEGPLDWI